MMTRDESGRFPKGVSGNPKGRPKRTDEEKFTSVLLAVVTPDRFRLALEKQQHKAEMGDLEAFKYICKLLGLEIDRKELGGRDGGEILVRLARGDD